MTKSLGKEERKQRYDALCRYEKNQYAEDVDIEEWEHFIEQYKYRIQITLPFMKQIMPVLKKDIADGGTVALKFLLFDTDSSGESVFSRFSPLCETELEKERIDLVDLLRQREKDHPNALALKFRFLLDRIQFNLHELPWDVLLRDDEIESALEDLETFKIIGCKSGEEETLIRQTVQKAEFYYKAWQNYLKNRNELESFSDYLIRYRDSSTHSAADSEKNNP